MHFTEYENNAIGQNFYKGVTGAKELELSSLSVKCLL